MLKQRIITGVIAAPIALACVFLLPPFEFSLFIAAVLIVGAWEWANFAGLGQPGRVAYAAFIAAAIAGASLLPALPVLGVSMIWWLIAAVFVVQYPLLSALWSGRWTILATGLVVLVPGWVALLQIKLYADSSYLICLLFFLIWGADIGAYFSGKAFGKRKLAPRVSPGKSWAGVYGGILTSLLIAAVMSLWFGAPAWDHQEFMFLLLACAVIAVISVLGDLSISMFKRQRDIKDSSNLLPGHGGVLDRIDSLLSASPSFALYLIWAGWV